MDELIGLLREVVPDVDFEKETRLVTDGIISSLSFVMIFSALADHYHIEIPFEEMIPENFDSAEAILTLISKISAK